MPVPSPCLGRSRRMENDWMKWNLGCIKPCLSTGAGFVPSTVVVQVFGLLVKRIVFFGVWD